MYRARLTRDWEVSLRGFFLKVLDIGRIIGLGVLGAGMVVVMAVGIYKVSMATINLGQTVVGTTAQPSVMSATDYLKGLEYLFLAPLGLLTFKALVRYMIVQVKLAAMSAREAEREQEIADRKLHHLKEFIVGLIAAILATDLVSKVVLEAGVTRLTDLSGELAVLIVTVAYVWVLSRKPVAEPDQHAARDLDYLPLDRRLHEERASVRADVELR